MKVLAQEKAWFTSEAGKQAFSKLNTLAEKSVFIYSYLKQVAKPEFDKNKTLFKFAFLFADAIANSNLPYSQYEALIDSAKNPFMKYLLNCPKCFSEKFIFISLMSILHSKANPDDSGEWIYDKNFTKDEDYLYTLEEMGCCYVPNPDYNVVDASLFEIEENLKLIELEIYWLFG